jgi:magnesium transporter
VGGGSGILCALISGTFEATLAGNTIVAFFITLVLALGESLTIQSMSIALQLIHLYDRERTRRYVKLLLKEALVGLMLGTGCSAISFGLSV